MIDDNHRNINKIGNAIKSMAENWNDRPKIVSRDLLDDIESDLEYALKALRAYRDANRGM